jgi:DNA-directed RNA polymerase subunit RPC12/RpoP
MPESANAVIAFSCPNCGAEIEIVEGYTNTKCKYCGSSLLITKKIGAPRVFSRPKINNPKKILRERFARDFRVIDLDLIFVPFIKVSSEIIGWLRGYKKGTIVQEPTYTDSGMNIDNISTPRVVGEKRIKKRIRRILEVKIDPSEFYRYGINRINTEGKKFEVYDDRLIHRYGDVIDLPLPVKEYLKKASDRLINEIIIGYSDFDEFEHHLKAIKKNAIIYYNPIFFSRIETGGENYTYSFDAVNGKPLLRDKESKNKEYSKKFFLGLNASYGLMVLLGVISSFTSFFLGKGIGFIFALFAGFGFWWLQYGNE